MALPDKWQAAASMEYNKPSQWFALGAEPCWVAIRDTAAYGWYSHAHGLSHTLVAKKITRTGRAGLAMTLLWWALSLSELPDGSSCSHAQVIKFAS